LLLLFITIVGYLPDYSRFTLGAPSLAHLSLPEQIEENKKGYLDLYTHKLHRNWYSLPILLATRKLLVSFYFFCSANLFLHNGQGIHLSND